MNEVELDAYIKELRNALTFRLKIIEHKKKFFSVLATQERQESEKVAVESEIEKLDALRKALNAN